MSNRLLLLTAIALTAARAEMLESVEPHMGTLVRIKLYAPDPQHAKQAFRKAFDRIAELDAALSNYKAGSELNRVCRDAVGRPLRIGPDLFRVLAAAQTLAEHTDGAFDITLGPVTRLWKGTRPPDPAAVAEARRHTGFRKLHLDAGNQTVLLDEAGMQLDAGGIAKGYAADEALAVLRGLGIPRALVAISGDLAIGSAPPGALGWNVAVGAAIRELHDCAISASGDREQHVDAGSVRYSHIVDPATGLGLVGSPTVSVIAARGIDADALSTAISVIGPARAPELLRHYPGAKLLLH